MLMFSWIPGGPQTPGWEPCRRPLRLTLYIYRIYANNLRIYFLEFSEEKLGCAQYLKQGWYRSRLETNDPVTR